MTIRITKNDLPKLATELRAMATATKTKDPFSQALTGAAFKAQDMLKEGMATAFDRPTQWTLNSTFVSKATPENLEAAVFFKDLLDRGVPAGRFLKAQIIGGQRGMKTFERVLSRRGFLPEGWRLVPGAAAKIDGEGNMDKQQLSEIVHGLTGQKLWKRGAKAGPDVRFFAILPNRRGAKGGPRPAIYQSVGKGMGRMIVPVLAYTASTSYDPRFDFDGIATRVIAEELPKRLVRAADRIWREAR